MRTTSPFGAATDAPYLSPVTMATLTGRPANQGPAELEAKIQEFLNDDHPARQQTPFLSSGNDLLRATQALTLEERARFVEKADQVRPSGYLSLVPSQHPCPQSYTRRSTYGMPSSCPYLEKFAAHSTSYRPQSRSPRDSSSMEPFPSPLEG